MLNGTTGRQGGYTPQDADRESLRWIVRRDELASLTRNTGAPEDWAAAMSQNEHATRAARQAATR